MEQLCFYHESQGLEVGWLKARNYICTTCHKTITYYAFDNPPIRCTQCATELNKCQLCDWQLDIKIGVELQLCIIEKDGRKRKKVFRECKNGLQYDNWKIIYETLTEPCLYLTIRNERFDAQLHLPTNCLVKNRMYKK